jgi:hypothetical protein
VRDALVREGASRLTVARAGADVAAARFCGSGGGALFASVLRAAFFGVAAAAAGAFAAA